MPGRTYPLSCLTILVCGFGCNRADPRAPHTAPQQQQQQPMAQAQESPVTNASTNPAPAARQFLGTLRGGVIAVGGDTTGWQLEQPDGMRVDVDVTKAADAASANEGKRVVIHGGLTKANWVERGQKSLLIADRIEPAGDGK